jgi:phage recombination protein Bet
MTGSALVANAVDPDVSAALQIYERIKPLKDALGVQNLTDGELQVFAYVARFTGLDPFTKQIYAIKRGGRVTHQTGIDGYRSVAERTKQYAGSDEAEFEACDCGSDDSPKDHPKLARVVVHRIRPDGTAVDQVGVARWHELKPPHAKYPNANDFQDSMWWKQAYGQLSKCAEANGLRKAFPRVLGGVYIADEMGGADVIEGEAREVPNAPAVNQTAAERIAERRARQEADKPVEPKADEPVEGEAEWIADADGDAPPAEPETSDEDGLSLIDLLQATEASLALEGNASAEQGAALRKTFEGLEKDVIQAGLRAVWPDITIVDEKARFTANQAAAILMTAGRTQPDVFRAAWVELGS